MRLPLLSVWLSLLLAVSPSDASGVECRRRLLTDDEQLTLEAFVLKSTGIAVDPYSIEACRDMNAVYVIVDFQRESEDTARLQCWLEEEIVVTG